MWGTILPEATIKASISTYHPLTCIEQYCRMPGWAKQRAPASSRSEVMLPYSSSASVVLDIKLWLTKAGMAAMAATCGHLRKQVHAEIGYCELSLLRSMYRSSKVLGTWSMSTNIA